MLTYKIKEFRTFRIVTEKQEKTLNVRLKVWFEVDGKPVIGEGRLKMLQAIHENGSIRHAATALGISYRKIRGAIRDMEIQMDQPLVFAYRGGEEGGGARLTSKAHALIASYIDTANTFHHMVDEVLNFKSTCDISANGKICHSMSKE